MSVPAALKTLGSYRIRQAVDITQRDPSDGIAASTILAIAYVETGCRNIESYAKDANGVSADTGALQYNRSANRTWLASIPGCPAGTWRPQAGRTALDAGFCPQWTPSVVRACDLLAWNVRYATDQRVPRGMRIKFAIAAWNCGPAGALRGWREAQDVDKYTTGKNYSDRVLQARVEVQDWLAARGYTT